MNSFAEIFELMKSRLDITDTAMKLWIDPIKPIKLNNNKAILFVAAPYARSIIVENYSAKFENILEDILGFPVEVEILTEDEISNSQRNKLAAGNNVVSKPIPDFDADDEIYRRFTSAEERSNYQHTFDTFIVGDSNNLAYSACKAVATGHNNNYNPLYIYSEPGLGKTHLLSAVKNEIAKNRPEMNVVFVSAETFVTEFVNSIRNDTNEQFKKKYRGADIFLVDDVQFFSGKKESQSELFYTFNDLHERGKQIILTSDRPPKEINDIEQRLLSRFEWGLLADISIPEFETRLAIIKRKADLIGMTIPTNVMEYMADKLKNNIRQLEGAITKMHALVEMTAVPATIMMAQNVVKEILNDHQPVPVTVEKIISEVARIYSVTPEEIKSQKRSAQISTARQIAIYVVHKTTGLAYTAIGNEFGGRDHSTIVYAINKVKSIIETDTSYRNTVNDLIKNISSLQS